MFNFGRRKEKINQEQEKRTEYELNVQKRAEVLNEQFYRPLKDTLFGKLFRNEEFKELADKYHSELDITPEEIFKNDAIVEDFARDLFQKGEMNEKDFNLLTKGSLIMSNIEYDNGSIVTPLQGYRREISGNLNDQKIELANIWADTCKKSYRHLESAKTPTIHHFVPYNPYVDMQIYDRDSDSYFKGKINDMKLPREEAKNLYEKCFSLIKLRDEKLWDLKKERIEKANLILKNNFEEDVKKLRNEKQNKRKEKLKKDEEERKKKVDDALAKIL